MSRPSTFTPHAGHQVVLTILTSCHSRGCLPSPPELGASFLEGAPGFILPKIDAAEDSFETAVRSGLHRHGPRLARDAGLGTVAAIFFSSCN